MFDYKSRGIRIFTFLISHCESFLTRRNLVSPNKPPLFTSPFSLARNQSGTTPNSPKAYNNFNRLQRRTLYRCPRIPGRK